MAGRPITKGRTPRPRQRLHRVHLLSDRLTTQWSAARKPAARLAIAVDMLRSLAADDYDDRADLDALMDEHATALRQAARRALAARKKKAEVKK